jgi:hypothetical protein
MMRWIARHWVKVTAAELLLTTSTLTYIGVAVKNDGLVTLAFASYLGLQLVYSMFFLQYLRHHFPVEWRS